VVIENAPFLFDGTPMPTRYWLVDPLLRDAVSRLEAAGGVRKAQAEVDPVALADAHDGTRPGARPDDRARPTRPAAERGCWRHPQGVKCLHAHLAWWLVGGDDPVGGWVAPQIARRWPRSGSCLRTRPGARRGS